MLALAARQVACFRPLLQAAQYATASDYSIVMQQASALTETKPLPNGDVGMVAGIPLETFKRKASVSWPGPWQAARSTVHNLSKQFGLLVGAGAHLLPRPDCRAAGTGQDHREHSCTWLAYGLQH
jgi:hypothetical protein